MDVINVRLGAVNAIRGRVVSHIGSWLGDKECIQVALSCATRDSGHLLEFLFNRDVEKAAKKATSNLALTAQEFEALFGSKARATREGSLAHVVADADFNATLKVIAGRSTDVTAAAWVMALIFTAKFGLS